MLTVALALCTAVATAYFPLLLHWGHHFIPRMSIKDNDWWLTSIAAICMAISIFLPDIHISNQTQTFQQHFVGGGMYTACIFLYIKRLLGWRLHWSTEILILFAWVSAFGVAVELLEFLATEAGIVHLANADTDWDLLANTLGGFTIFLVFRLAKAYRHV